MIAIHKNKWVMYVLAIAIVCSTIVIGETRKAQAAGNESYHWQNVVTGAGGGFVPGIIFNPSEQDLIYARTDIGGAYRWDSAQSSWIPLTDFVGWDDWNNNGIDALATDPVDPDRLYLAAGTYTNEWTSENGVILRSDDRGDTWETSPLPFKVGGNMPGRSMGERLIVDPNDNRILYFGARSGNGLWRSMDYGTTWSKVESFPNAGTYVQDPSNSYQSDIVGLAWITFDPTTGSPGQATQTIYVGVADTAESIYRSTDGGQSWHAVPGQPAGYLPHHGVLSSTGSLYITYSDGVGPYDGTKGEVWKLDTATGVWTDISPVPSSSADNYYGYGGLAVDAQQPNTLMVATLNSWWPDAIIYRSTDGGTTWTQIWDWNGYPERTLRYTQDVSDAPWLTFGANPQPPEVTPKLGWMIGDLEIDPFDSDRMMYGTGATIYGTNNLTNWDADQLFDISVMANGIEEMAVLDLVSPPTGAHLVSAIGDVSGFRHDDLDSPPSTIHTSPTYASSNSIDFAELVPNFMVRTGSANKDEDPNAKALGFSYDGGANWFSSSSEPAGSGGEVAVSADGISIVWRTGDGAVHVSQDSGNSWTQSAGIPDGAHVIADRVNPQLFYAFAAGNIYVSIDGGSTFAATSASGLPASGSSDLRAVPGREGDIWFAGGDETGGPYGLWHSTDYGESFTKLANVEEADSIGFGKSAPGEDYPALYSIAQIDGERGFFRSDNGGTSWVRINNDEHQYARVTTITGDPRIYGRVYVGTNGRGIVYGDPDGGGGQLDAIITPTSATFDKHVNEQADIAVNLDFNGHTLDSIYKDGLPMIEGGEYTISGNTVTFGKAYLANLPIGTHSFVFDFSAGADAVLTVNIIDSTSILPAAPTAVVATAGDGQVSLSWQASAHAASYSVKRAELVNGTYAVIADGITTTTYTDTSVSNDTTYFFTVTASNESGTSPDSVQVSATPTGGGQTPTGDLTVQYKAGDTDATNNVLKPSLRIANNSTDSVTLSSMTMRYYFAHEQGKPLAVFCDWAQIGCSNVSANIVQLPNAVTGASHYLEIAYASGAGNLAPGMTTGELMLRIHNQDWSTMDESDDYSFDGQQTSYVDWDQVTLYENGTLVWGIEP